MRIIDRYILSNIVFAFLIILMIFGLLYVLIDSATNLDEFLRQKVSIKILVQYYMSYMPVIIVQTAGIVCLIAVLFSYSQLNSHNEVIALRAGGLDFWKITRPAIVFAVLVGAAVFFLNEQFVPQAEGRARKIRDENIILEVDRTNKKKPVINYLTYYGLKNRLYCIDAFDANTGEMKGITIHEYDDKLQLKEKTIALRGVWTGIAWKFYDIHSSSFTNEDLTDASVKVSGEKLMDIKETPTDFLKQSLNTSAMNSRQLYEYIQRFSKSGALRAITNLRVDWHEKLTRPFAVVIIVLVGLPLSLMTGRRKAQTFMSLAIAVAVGFLYYICNAVGIALGKGGLFEPFVAAWLAPVLFAGLAAYLIRTKF